MPIKAVQHPQQVAALPQTEAGIAASITSLDHDQSTVLNSGIALLCLLNLTVAPHNEIGIAAFDRVARKRPRAVGRQPGPLESQFSYPQNGQSLSHLRRTCGR